MLRFACRALVTRLNSNLKQLRPQLTGYEEPILLGIVGNAVQYGAWPIQFPLIDNAVEVDPSQNFPGSRRNTNNLIALPDVCVDLTVNEFEFVQLINRMPRLIGDPNALRLFESSWIEKTQIGSAITHDQLRLIVRQAPSFAFVPGSAQ